VAWIGVEGFHHFGMARLRRKLGLSCALTCNRYLLWGLTGALWTIYQMAYVIQQIEFDATDSSSSNPDDVFRRLAKA
jgi:hypothetical protein